MLESAPPDLASVTEARSPLAAFLTGDRPFYVIAEIGSNHDADLDKALALVDAAAASGAHAVKVQSWRADRLLNPMQVLDGDRLEPSPVLPVLERLTLPDSWHRTLMERAMDLGLDFLSSPFDPERARFLNDLGVPAFKIASGDLTYDPLLRSVAAFGRPVILSTGMADEAEITHALDVLSENGAGQVILLHCVGAYPPRIEDANIAAVATLRQRFDTQVGFSDHHMDNEPAFAAFALGARVFEKHFTLSRAAGTPDAPFAMEPAHLRTLVDGLDRLAQAMGDGSIGCMPSEQDGRTNGRRSLFLAGARPAGAVLTEADIAIVRPAIGDFVPADLEHVVGRRLATAVPAGSPLRRRHLVAEDP